MVVSTISRSAHTIAVRVMITLREPYSTSEFAGIIDAFFYYTESVSGSIEVYIHTYIHSGPEFTDQAVSGTGKFNPDRKTLYYFYKIAAGIIGR
jgi:hypothetical protein